VVGIVLVVTVVLGLVLRGMSPEERLKFGQAVVDGLVFIKDTIAKPPKGGEAFYRALRARTKWALVTPAIVVTYLVVFVLLLAGSGSLGDPRTLVDWGSSIGTRTTNDEWWRLGTAMFVHAGVIHLIAEIAGLVQVGLLVERLVGRLAFAVVYVASGVLAGVWSLTLHPVSVQAGAAGAIFGIYGLLLATLVLGLAQRASLTVPVRVLKGLWPGVAVFLVYNALMEGIFSEAMQAGFVVGFTGGMLIAGRVISDKPPARRVAAVVTATVAIVVALAAPLRGLADVSGEVAKVKDVVTPKFPPPPPRNAQNRSGFSAADAVTAWPPGSITVADVSASQSRPACRDWAPSPPPRACPAAPTDGQIPVGMPRPAAASV